MSSSAAQRARVRRIRATLLEWYRTHRRDLPWRRTRDPYAIWISETMLQQTRVDTVIPYYERFLQRFPDVRALADAAEDEVTGLWAGLGYYSRARNLRAAARRVVDEYDGRLPDDVQALRELPGIGRYTAGALASIAFDAPEPIVDGNVVRVLSRIHGIREDTRDPAVMERIWDEAASLARGEHPGELNQALMEIGALVCTPRTPRCSACPVARSCSARRAGDARALPYRSRRTPARRIEAVCAWIERRGRALAWKRPARGLMAGMWELPGGDLEDGEAPLPGLQRVLLERAGIRVLEAAPVGTVEHVFTHRRLKLHVFRCTAVRGRVRIARGEDAPQTHRWVPPGEVGRLPVGAATHKALSALTAHDRSDPRDPLGVGAHDTRRARPRAAGVAAGPRP